MEQMLCPIKDYIQIWLGLVGPAISLQIPLAMAQVRV